MSRCLALGGRHQQTLESPDKWDTSLSLSTNLASLCPQGPK